MTIDSSDHFSTTIDSSSGFGAFGNEYYGLMPQRRWIITRTDILALAAIGYTVRASFNTWQDTKPDCP